MVLDFTRGNVFAAGGDDDVLDAIDDINVSVFVNSPDVPGIQPALFKGFSCFFCLVPIASDNAGTLQQYFTLIREYDFRVRCSVAHAADF